MTDEEFFATHPDRQARIRLPTKTLVIDKQRAARYEDEFRGEFWSLGAHDKDRRRVLVWRVPPGNPWYDPQKRKLLPIPFLVFAEETIEDRDDVLLPILDDVMNNTRNRA